MARYDYRCVKCGHVEEKDHSMNESPQYVCQKCEGEMAKAVSLSSFILKGKGWYKDGY